MISGEFTASGQAQVTISVSNGESEAVKIVAVIDTGYMGALLLTRSLAARLQLPQIDQEELRLANGSIVRFAVHEAVVSWLEEERVVSAHVADGDILIGVELLRGNIGTIEVLDGGTVTIEAAE